MAVFLKLVLLQTVLVAHIARGKPKGQAPQNTDQGSMGEAVQCLVKFGYLFSNETGSAEISGALDKFQKSADLNVTGELDDATIQKMHEMHCEMKDMGCSTPGTRVKRSSARKVCYVLEGSWWRKKHLTYKIGNFPSSMKNNQKGVKDAIRVAAKAWSNVSGLTIDEATDISKADIVFQFVKVNHSDCKPFDGPDGKIAHAFFPAGGGDVCFDDDEEWTVDYMNSNRYDLVNVALHELGHSLGLLHSTDRNAVMKPKYWRSGGNPRSLTQCDIDGIQKLYGPPAWSLCRDSSVDAMLTVDVNGEKMSHAFKGEHFWGLANTSVNPESTPIDGLPGNLDAAVPSAEPGGAFFFKGSQYWKMTKLNLDDGFPQPISSGFPGIPDNLDAALRWVRNGKVYFFKGAQYWEFDEKLKTTGQPGVSYGYPKRISDGWVGLPNNIDGAFTYKDNRIYFFKGTNYYRFDDNNLKVPSGYPVSTGRAWFGCSS